MKVICKKSYNKYHKDSIYISQLYINMIVVYIHNENSEHEWFSKTGGIDMDYKIPRFDWYFESLRNYNLKKLREVL